MLGCCVVGSLCVERLYNSWVGGHIYGTSPSRADLREIGTTCTSFCRPDKYLQLNVTAVTLVQAR